ncbi:MAG: hypothetical protein EBE86_009990 [Hormoscilla sp. GUM202]|nr:hypothetical protein [Hormoscilla sp. GUM202]
MSSLEELFCHIDDFCQEFEPQWQKQMLSHGLKTRKRAIRLRPIAHCVAEGSRSKNCLRSRTA